MKGIFGEFKLLSAVMVAVLVTVALNACANPKQSQQDEDKGIYVMAPEARAPLPQSASLSGNYLAGRFAQRQQDWDAAHVYMDAVIRHDTENDLLLQRTFLLSLGAGNYDRARELAMRIVDRPAENNELAFIFMACDALAAGSYKAAIDMISRLPDDGFGQYTKPLLTAWAIAGDKGKDAGIEYLRSQAEEDDPTYNIHVALMHELSGDMDMAARHYGLAAEGGLPLHGAVLAANFFQRAGDMERAGNIYAGLQEAHALTSLGGGKSARHQITPRPNITRPADGAAVALFDLATLLYERRAYDSAQIYGRLVQLMSPDSAFGGLMMGDIAALNEHYAKAVAAYGRIPEESPIYWMSRLRIAEVYEVADKPEAAVALLNDLAKVPQTRLQALVGLGDLHRRHERYAEAIEAYDAALADVGDITKDHWAIVYARGMALERLDNWPRAEKDLLLALEFQPENPMILNYIGYSWAEKGMNLERALDFTRRAADLRPDDGYILDSYGWTLYRLGNYEESVVWLEKASAKVPDDSTILDHLADAYWQSGRRAEARFKWQRARDLSKDANFRATVQSKLLRGMEPPTVVVHQEAKL